MCEEAVFIGCELGMLLHCVLGKMLNIVGDTSGLDNSVILLQEIFLRHLWNVDGRRLPTTRSMCAANVCFL